MGRVRAVTCGALLLCGALLPCSALAAQTKPAAGPGATARPGAGGSPAVGAAAAGALAKAAAPKLSDGARAALAAARELARAARGLDGEAESTALQTAATAYDKIATDFAHEPPAAAQAAFAAGDLWRRHGSAQQAEQDYLSASRLDPERFGQRGKLGAADMQRRQDRDADALATYVEAAAADPATSRAQTARLWQGRLLHTLGRDTEAVTALRAALDAARTSPQVIETGNELARLLVATGELDAAAQAIAHVEATVAAAAVEDPVQKERLQKSVASMSARRALQRARDQRANPKGDAQMLEESRRGGR